MKPSATPACPQNIKYRACLAVGIDSAAAAEQLGVLWLPHAQLAAGAVAASHAATLPAAAPGSIPAALPLRFYNVHQDLAEAACILLVLPLPGVPSVPSGDR